MIKSSEIEIENEKEAKKDKKDSNIPPIDPCNYLFGDESPTINFKSEILSYKMLILLQAYLPILYQNEPWTLLYSLRNHGSDFSSFYNKVNGYQKSIIVVETEQGEIFGGFASTEWKIFHTFLGNGQSFIFKFCKKLNDSFQYFGWTEKNDYFMWCSSEKIAMGGGGEGFGFVLDSDFHTGGTSRSETFNNEPLSSSENGVFNIVNVEVWGFKSSINKKTYLE